MNVPSKLPHVGTTIFTVMSQLAAEHNAINLGQGFPDFNPDSALMNHVTQAMQDGHNQYPPMAGVMTLRERIAEKCARMLGRRYDPVTDITVTSGASEALMAAILAFVHPGDEVIVIEPFYDLYIPGIELAGGHPVVVPMLAPGKHDHSSAAASETYAVDWQRVREAITPHTRMLIINFPHNPTGINLTPSDLDQLESIVQETGILVLSDEVYEHLTFDGMAHHSLASRDSLAAHAIIVSSFGKTFHATGWKVGYCCAPAPLTVEIRKIHQFLVFTVPSPLQVGLARYMEDPETYLSLPAFYQRKRDLLAEGLSHTRFRPLPSQGTFFLLADYSTISDETEADFARRLTIEHGVTVIPMSAFYADPNAPESNHQLVRFCFAKQEDTLAAALQKLTAV